MQGKLQSFQKNVGLLASSVQKVCLLVENGAA